MNMLRKIDELDVLIDYKKVRLKDVCHQGMIYFDPIIVNEKEYCFAIRVNEYMKIPEELIAHNLKAMKGKN